VSLVKTEKATAEGEAHRLRKQREAFERERALDLGR
jgi:hypothetical protein